MNTLLSDKTIDQLIADEADLNEQCIALQTRWEDAEVEPEELAAHNNRFFDEQRALFAKVRTVRQQIRDIRG